jgi:hypothetical protein
VSDHGRWEPLAPAALLAVFEDYDAPWWVAGGWAIDLFLGHTTRDHADLDVVVLRDHQQAVRAALPGWDLQQANDGALTPWPEGEDLRPEVNGVWARPDSDGPWRMDILFDGRKGDDWVSRRNAEITMPLGHLGKVTSDGVPYLVPEVVLLYKAKATREKDEADFDAALPKLGIGARCWLAAALEVVHPDHPWIGRIL